MGIIVRMGLCVMVVRGGGGGFKLIFSSNSMLTIYQPSRSWPPTLRSPKLPPSEEKVQAPPELKKVHGDHVNMAGSSSLDKREAIPMGLCVMVVGGEVVGLS